MASDIELSGQDIVILSGPEGRDFWERGGAYRRRLQDGRLLSRTMAVLMLVWFAFRVNV